MNESISTRLRRALARTIAGFERLEARQFAAPWRSVGRRPGVRGPGQA